MDITLIGIGPGDWLSLTQAAARALERALVILGAPRLLEGLPAQCGGRRIPCLRTSELVEALTGLNGRAGQVAVAFSGDIGFYSGAASLLRTLQTALPEARCTLLPGLSSPQVLAARLGRPWQGWKLVSAHGVACDPAAACAGGGDVFFLTGGSCTPASLCARLTEAGLGDYRATAASRLGYPEEAIVTGTAAQLAEQTFAPLSVLLVEGCPAPLRQSRVGGIPDEEFIRAKVPMTKQEVRAAALALLAPHPGDCLWDLGAGTGSVSVELALAAPEGQVYAVERNEDAQALILENRRKFGLHNLTLIAGAAPESLAGLPAPDRVFVGGTGGHMAETLAAVRAANPAARVVISAIAIESLSAALAALQAQGFENIQVSQISVSRSRPAGGLHLMMAQNPVYLISGGAL
mgnify:CR=1 FL=1